MNDERIIDCLEGVVSVQRGMLGVVERKTVADQILGSEQYKAFAVGKSDLATITLKTAITRTSLINDPVVPAGKPYLDPGVRRVLGVRDLLRQYTISQGAVELPTISSKTINATGQLAGSPGSAENVTLPESVYSFTQSFTPVVTYSHILPCSDQLLEDSAQLQAVIEGEMAYGLAFGIEDGLLNHDGSTGRLNGLLNGATAYSVTSPTLTREPDIIRDALEQIELAGFAPTGIVLHPSDWRDIDLEATDDSAYLSGTPRTITGKTLWGIPVVTSLHLAQGTFLCGDFLNAGALFVRDAAVVEISRSDSANFQKNMVTIRAQERLAWVTTNSTALVKGSL